MLKEAKEIQSLMIELRRDFHMYPELGFEEFRTAGVISEIMGSLGYRGRTGVGKTGVVAELGEGAPIVAIRADMDALRKPMMSLTNQKMKAFCMPVGMMRTWQLL